MSLLDSLSVWQNAVLLSTLAGITIPLGAYLAKIECFSPNWLEEEFRHTVIAFGGGALFAAVSLVLVPQGSESLSTFWAIGLFLAGGFVFYLFDRVIESRGGQYSQLIAMLSDFTPEAMALGAMLVERNPATLLLTFLIALQNLPEGFNAYREIISNQKQSSRYLMKRFIGLAFVGPIAALIGVVFLAGQGQILGGVMMFSSGGILYLVFQDIAPQAYLQRNWAPPLGAVLGYGLGLFGHLLMTP